MGELENIPEEEYGTDEVRGIDSLIYVYKDCEYCKGEGYVSIDDGGIFPKQVICGCVIEGRRRHACEIKIKSMFGDGGSKMTLKKYLPGESIQNKAALRGCLNYIEHFDKFKKEGMGFALLGEHGCGKTHLAIATLIALLKRWPNQQGNLLAPHYMSIPDLLRQARQKISDSSISDVIDRSMKADILLMDDLGAEYHKISSEEGMSWVDEQLYIILDHRLINNLPTLYTTNLKKSDLKNLLDPRVVRRLDTKTLALWPIEKNKSPEINKEKAQLKNLLMEGTQ